MHAPAPVIHLFSFVTMSGASSGIGAGTALRFAKLGAKLSLTGRDEENLKKTAEECRKQPGCTEVVFILFLIYLVNRILYNTFQVKRQQTGILLSYMTPF